MTLETEFTLRVGAKLDYKFDWAPVTNDTEGGEEDWLDTANTEKISTYTIAISPDDGGLVKITDAKQDTDTSVLVWLQAVAAGKNDNYEVKCSIVTDSSPAREDNRTIIIRVR